MKEVRTADPTGLNGGGPHSGPYGTRDEPGGIAMEQCIEELVVRLLLLPFQLFWWAFKHDFGLLETPQEIPRKPGPASLHRHQCSGTGSLMERTWSSSESGQPPYGRLRTCR